MNKMKTTGIIIFCISFLLILICINCKHDESFEDEPPADEPDDEPVLSTDKVDFHEDVVKGQSATAYFTVSNTGSENVSWTATPDQPCVTVFPESGTLMTESITLKIVINTTGLDTGFYHPVINVSSDSFNGQNSAQLINVSVFVGDYLAGHQLTSNVTISGYNILYGDIVVPDGFTLTISPGAIIKIVTGSLNWDGGSEPGIVDIEIMGTLHAVGTADNIIVLAPKGENPAPGSWWGIGQSENTSSVTLKYFCSKYARYGIFIYSSSTSAPSIDYSMFTYTDFDGITDFGPDSSYSYNTFINSDFGISRARDGSHADIDHCLFYNNSWSDVKVNDSDCSINITNSNMLDPNNITGYNLYISDILTDNSSITADNCYGITSWFAAGTNTININNPSIAEIAGTGCGFSIPLENE